MKKFDVESIAGPDSLEAQARRLVAHFDELFFANLQKKHPTVEMEGELPAREMRAIVILSNRGRSIRPKTLNQMHQQTAPARSRTMNPARWGAAELFVLAVPA